MSNEYEGNSRPTRSASPLIRGVAYSRGGSDARRLLLVGACLIVSAVIHMVLFFVFFLVPFEKATANTPMETAVIETKVEDQQQKQPDLENDEIGIDPDLPTN